MTVGLAPGLPSKRTFFYCKHIDSGEPRPPEEGDVLMRISLSRVGETTSHSDCPHPAP